MPRLSLVKPVQWLFSIVYLFLIIVTIPLAFDVGGDDCGIAFTFALTAFYLVMSTIRLVSRNTKFSILGSILYYLQHLIIIPSLLILHLSLFSEESSPVWMKVVYPWSFFVRHATPLFSILEGFCTLLVIQATGQIARWAVRKSDTWMFVQILASGTNLTLSLYFLYRIYTFPVAIELTSATLIGAVLTISTFLGLYGIISGKGTPVESSMLFSYTVYGLYVTFTDFQSSITSSLFFPFLTPTGAEQTSATAYSTPVSTANSGGSLGLLSSILLLGGLLTKTSDAGVSTAIASATSTVSAIGSEAVSTLSRSSLINGLPHRYQNTVPPFPPIIITGYTNLVTTLAELTPKGFITAFEFFLGTISTISPSVAVSLAYRLFVFFAATRIIPSLKATPPPTPSNSLSPTASPTRNVSSASLSGSTSSTTALSPSNSKANPTYSRTNSHGPTTITAKSFSSPSRKRISKSRPVLFIIYSYAPCIIIAVYTHLLLQHSSIFGATISVYGRNPGSTEGTVGSKTTWYSMVLNLLGGNSKEAWQFWGWANIFNTLALYGIELLYGGSDSQELISNHFKTD
ncbi:Ice2p [Sugiyamaella lignohabitans]|uniref:Ice2p n=1 Tax=Sugiyamaella lignohabitans TaxID=796027 RepID=A0A167FAY2_9ASCO|nr:Ice2p [Sugiyamaella lignohabitans]ANB15051.1 Ice2p [Sugiyamaella lignohabitans]